MDVDQNEFDFSEAERLKAVHALELLDTPPEPAYDAIVMLLQQLTDAPVCIISLFDDQRVWFKASIGTPHKQVPRQLALGIDAIENNCFIEIPDLLQSERYKTHPSTASPLNYRYYAGAPLMTKYGQAIGTLAIMDFKPRTLSTTQRAAMEALANQTSTLFNLRTSQQELKQLSDAQQRILAIAGHDIKSPLSALLMVLDLSATGDLSPEEQEEMLPMLRGQVHGALRLINNLVQWGQLIVQRSTRYVTTFYLYQEVEQCLNELRAKATAKGNTLINEVPENELVRADPYGAAFILRNLLGNANKFTTNGTITVSFERHAAGAWLHVSDTGIGMSPQMALQLQRQAAGQQRKGTAGEEGSGLGLALVADYVRSVNGQLLIDTEDGKGTLVSVEI